MKFKEPHPPNNFRKRELMAAIICLLMFLSGCSTEEKKPSGEPDNNKSKNTEAVIPKALHEDLMSEQEARFQGLMRINQSIQEERDKLLADLAKFDALKLALANTEEERNRIIAATKEFKASSQASANAQSAANAQTVQQLSLSNTQMSEELATSKQRVAQLELSVSRMQNPANMLKIRQLILEKEFLSKELAEQEQKMQELQTAHASSSHTQNLNELKKLKSQNAALSQSLAKSEKRLKDQQAFQNRPRSPADPRLIEELKTQNAKLSSELDKLKQQLAKATKRPKDIVKTLAEWKVKLRNKGPMSPAKLAASVGKPHDKEDRKPSGDGDETIFTWRDLVKVDLEIRTIGGKIETITFDK